MILDGQKINILDKISHNTKLEVYRNTEKCYIYFYRLGNQHIFVRLQIKYLSIAGQNLDKNLNFWMKFVTSGTKNDTLDDIFVVSQ